MLNFIITVIYPYLFPALIITIILIISVIIYNKKWDYNKRGINLEHQPQDDHGDYFSFTTKAIAFLQYEKKRYIKENFNQRNIFYLGQTSFKVTLLEKNSETRSPFGTYTITARELQQDDDLYFKKATPDLLTLNLSDKERVESQILQILTNQEINQSSMESIADSLSEILSTLQNQDTIKRSKFIHLKNISENIVLTHEISTLLFSLIKFILNNGL